MADKDKNKISSALTEGSHYLVKSLATREKLLETRGFFEGYITLGRGHALRVRLDDSHGEDESEIRIIPSHMITSIDILEEKESSEEDESTSSSYFG